MFAFQLVNGITVTAVNVTIFLFYIIDLHIMGFWIVFIQLLVDLKTYTNYIQLIYSDLCFKKWLTVRFCLVLSGNSVLRTAAVTSTKYNRNVLLEAEADKLYQ